MSKMTKLLSTGYDIIMELKSVSGEEVIYEDHRKERLHNIVLWLEELCNHQRLYYVPKQYGETGPVKVFVKDETSEGVPAQVRFFPVNSGGPEQKADGGLGEINIIREITDWNGKLEAVLPAGDYMAEISKGSEYEINTVYFSVYPNREARLIQELIPITHLKADGWYSGDLHHHSIYSSPVYNGTDPVIESPAQVCRSMAAMGASYGALSDHHNILNHKEWSALKRDSFTPVISKEISTSNGHVMALGADEDIIYRIPVKENRTDTYLRNEFIRISDEIKKLGGVAQINHPKDSNKSISWNNNFDDIIQIFDTMEIWNGSNPMIKGSPNYKAFLLWRRLLEEGRFIPATSGSDTHNILADDYHVYYNKLNWLAGLIINGGLSLPETLKDEAVSFLKLYQEMKPVFHKWLGSNLTSAGVRTYVQVKGEITQDKLLAGLKKGNSFLTNGPILIPDIDGMLPGDTVRRKADKISIRLKLLSNRPLKKLTIHTNGNRIRNYPLEPADTGKGTYDYSRILSGIDIKNVKWMFFTAEEDCTNMAITNPIFFVR